MMERSLCNVKNRSGVKIDGERKKAGEIRCESRTTAGRLGRNLELNLEKI